MRTKVTAAARSGGGMTMPDRLDEADQLFTRPYPEEKGQDGRQGRTASPSKVQSYTQFHWRNPIVLDAQNFFPECLNILSDTLFANFFPIQGTVKGVVLHTEFQRYTQNAFNDTASY